MDLLPSLRKAEMYRACSTDLKDLWLFCALCSLIQEEKKRKREKEHCDSEGEADAFDPGKKVEVEPPPDRPVRACRTQPGKTLPLHMSFLPCP